MTCQGCGTPIEPSGPRDHRRKWCSERCRKAQYGGTCVDCGAPTYGGNGQAKAPERCLLCRATYQHEARRWTREAVVAAIQAWTAEHGRPPTATDWNSAMARAASRPERPDDFPPVATVQREFGSWANAVEAAGFDRPRPGVYGRPDRAEMVEACQRLYTSGLAYRHVAAELGIGKTTALRYLHRGGVQMRPSGWQPKAVAA